MFENNASHINLGEKGFKQTLDLASETIYISQANFNISLRFVDESMVIKSHSKTPESFSVSFGTWRYKPLHNVRIDMFNARGNYTPDNISINKTRFVWYHNNAASLNNVDSLAQTQGIDVKNVGKYTCYMLGLNHGTSILNYMHLTIQL